MSGPIRCSCDNCEHNGGEGEYVVACVIHSALKYRYEYCNQWKERNGEWPTGHVEELSDEPQQ